jgi:pimeloyl-[acyl-carrier protein] methyl ester esterase
VAAALTKNFRMHPVDLPGHGRRGGENWPPLSELVDALSQAAPSKVSLVGWSLGGTLALAWASARPQQVAALVLVATTPNFAARDGWKEGWSAAALDEFERSLEDDCNATLQRFVALQCLGDCAERRIFRILRDQMRGELPSLIALQPALRFLREIDLRDLASRLQQPVLLIHGERDCVVSIEAARRLAHRIPGCRLRVFPECGHAPFLSRPGEFVREVSEFLHAASHRQEAG